MIDFNCSRCNSCCTNILTSINGNIFGLYLSKDEIDLFAKESIFPLFGRGDPIEITAYQLGVQVCPNFLLDSNNFATCLVHEKRPLACRTFPVLSYDKNNEKIELCKSCPIIKEAYDNNQEINKDSLLMELKAQSKKIMQLEKEMMTGKQDEFMWPINKKQWIEIKEIYKIIK